MTIKILWPPIFTKQIHAKHDICYRFCFWETTHGMLNLYWLTMAVEDLNLILGQKFLTLASPLRINTLQPSVISELYPSYGRHANWDPFVEASKNGTPKRDGLITKTSKHDPTHVIIWVLVVLSHTPIARHILQFVGYGITYTWYRMHMWYDHQQLFHHILYIYS